MEIRVKGQNVRLDPGDLACKTRVTVDIAVCTEILSEKIFNVLTMQTITMDGGRCAK